jgi:hypothetical protein
VVDHDALQEKQRLSLAGAGEQDSSDILLWRVRMQSLEPRIGDWYRSHGQQFEVVAIDDSEGVVEIQHADGDIEEMDLDDWAIRARAGALQTSDAPEDPRAGNDNEHEDFSGFTPQAFDALSGLRADSLNDLDLFD